MIDKLKQLYKDDYPQFCAIIFMILLFGGIIIAISTAEHSPPPPKRQLDTEGVWYTKEKYVACHTSDLMEDFNQLARQKDSMAMAKMVMRGSCVLLKPGITVYVIDLTWDGGQVKIRPSGEPEGLWTMRAAISRDAVTPAPVDTKPKTKKKK